MFSLLIGHIKLLLDPKLKLYLSLWLRDRSKVGKGHGDVELETPVQPEMGTSETAHCRCCISRGLAREAWESDRNPVVFSGTSFFGPKELH